MKKNRPANLKLRRSKFVYVINEKSRLSVALLTRSDFEKWMGQISLHKRLFIPLSVSVEFVAQLVVAPNWYLRGMGSNSVDSQFSSSLNTYNFLHFSSSVRIIRYLFVTKLIMSATRFFCRISFSAITSWLLWSVIIIQRSWKRLIHFSARQCWTKTPRQKFMNQIMRCDLLCFVNRLTWRHMLNKSTWSLHFQKFFIIQNCRRKNSFTTNEISTAVQL